MIVYGYGHQQMGRKVDRHEAMTLNGRTRQAVCRGYEFEHEVRVRDKMVRAGGKQQGGHESQWAREHIVQNSVCCNIRVRVRCEVWNARGTEALWVLIEGRVCNGGEKKSKIGGRK